MEQDSTAGQLTIPAALSGRIGAWQEAWMETMRRPLPTNQAESDARNLANAHLLGAAFVLLGDVRNGTDTSAGTIDRMNQKLHSMLEYQGLHQDPAPGGPYPYGAGPDTAHQGTGDGRGRGPFDPAPAGVQ